MSIPNYHHLKPGDQDWRWCHEYARRVVAGEITAGVWIQWACKRHLKDLSRDDIYFDEAAAQSIVLWFKFIPITDGKDVGKPTILAPWQIFVVCTLVAWKYRATKLRRYKYAYIQVGRKGGKSTLSGGLTLYYMYKAEFRPRAYSVATKKDQAKILWSAAHTMICLSPRLKTLFDARANDILLPSKVGEFKPLASDSNSLDGLNPTIATLDECHAIKDRNLYGVMVSAFGAQEQGLMLTITTAGTVLDGICTDLNKMGKQVLEGLVDYDDYFYAIYEVDENDEWDDETVWEKANPGISMGLPRLDYLRGRCVEAKMSLEEKANFLTKHLNLFVSGYDKWLDINEVKACRHSSLQLSDYIGQDCYVGIDRARVKDLMSFCILFPNDLYGADYFWINLLPRNTFNTATDHLKKKYKMAVAEGTLRLVDTPTVRDEQVKTVIREIAERFNVLMFGYDPWHMGEIAQDMGDGDDGEGYPMVSVSQGTGNMSEPAKKTEGLIADRSLRHNDSLFEFAAECAIAKFTDNNNVKIVRESDRTDKIDPIISGIIALSCATLQEKPEGNIYEERGFLWV